MSIFLCSTRGFCSTTRVHTRTELIKTIINISFQMKSITITEQFNEKLLPYLSPSKSFRFERIKQNLHRLLIEVDRIHSNDRSRQVGVEGGGKGGEGRWGKTWTVHQSIPECLQCIYETLLVSISLILHLLGL